MTKREKIEIKASLKAQDFKVGEEIKATAFIKEVFDVETRYGDKTIIKLDDGDSIFMNARTNNLLIEKYGDDDNAWLNKGVRLVCEFDEMFKKNMLVLYPIA